MKDILLSIIVPVYNCEKYICKCVESLNPGENKTLEIIIVNDGSTDESLKKCSILAQKYSNIKLINSENFGVSHARNIGIEHSSGEWITFVDADDYLESSFLSKCEDYLHDSNLNFIKFGTVCDYYSNEELQNNEYRKIEIFEVEDESKTKILNLKSNYNDIFAANAFDSVWCCLLKKSIIEKYKISFDESMKVREDSQFIINYAKHVENICFLNEYLYHYRIIGKDTYHFRREIQINDIRLLFSAYEELLQHLDINDVDSMNILYRYIYQQVFGGIIHFASFSYNKSFLKLYKYIKAIYRNFNSLINLVDYNDGFHKLIIALMKNKMFFLVGLLCRTRFFRLK